MKQHSSHGVPRLGTGRKPGSSSYGEPTVALRVPASQQDTILSFLKTLRQQRQYSLPPANAAILVPDNDAPDSRLPLFGSRIPAGFPDFAPIELRDGQKLTIWDVVTSVIHTVS